MQRPVLTKRSSYNIGSYAEDDTAAILLGQPVGLPGGRVGAVSGAANPRNAAGGPVNLAGGHTVHTANSTTPRGMNSMGSVAYPLQRQSFPARLPYQPLASQPGPQVAHQPPSRARRGLNFDSRFMLYGGAWSCTPWGDYIALATYNEEANNCVHVLQGEYTQGPALNITQPASPNSLGTISRQASPVQAPYQQVPPQSLSRFTPVADAMVTLPQTKVAWDPSGPSRNNKLKLLSTGDCLRIWDLSVDTGILEASRPLAKKSKGTQGPAAPLTSFDWSRVDNSLAITASIDTTCTLWDLQAQAVRTQLIAHDSEVFDVAFLPESPHQFVSAGADGSARLFDLRSLDNSTILYESQPSTPMLRIAPNPSDPNILAAIGYQRTGIAVVDIRASRNPLLILEAHQASVNGISWSPDPQNKMILASGGDDCQLLIWDLQLAASNAETGGLVGSFTDNGQINNVMWSPDGQYIASIRGKSFQALKFQLP